MFPCLCSSVSPPFPRAIQPTACSPASPAGRPAPPGRLLCELCPTALLTCAPKCLIPCFDAFSGLRSHSPLLHPRLQSISFHPLSAQRRPPTAARGPSLIARPLRVCGPHALNLLLREPPQLPLPRSYFVAVAKHLSASSRRRPRRAHGTPAPHRFPPHTRLFSNVFFMPYITRAPHSAPYHPPLPCSPPCKHLNNSVGMVSHTALAVTGITWRAGTSQTQHQPKNKLSTSCRVCSSAVVSGGGARGGARRMPAPAVA